MSELVKEDLVTSNQTSSEGTDTLRASVAGLLDDISNSPEAQRSVMINAHPRTLLLSIARTGDYSFLDTPEMIRTLTLGLDESVIEQITNIDDVMHLASMEEI